MASAWRDDFAAAIADVGDGMNYEQAAKRLRRVIKTGLLQLDDIQENPERFFEAHRLLAKHATRLGPGFFIRFTVHFNLFAGTVVAVGTREQLQALKARNRERPLLGCFALTERLAGVNSGLVVDTTAEFHDGHFIINTPTPSAAKNWISQGLVADEGVVIASLKVNGTSYGPQAFLLSLRNVNGDLKPEITAKDMGRKSVGNDLDNASLIFDRLHVPLSSLLSRYLVVSPAGHVSKPQGNKRSMDIIGQRLFSGRVAVAEAALEFGSALVSSTLAFASTKRCWSPDAIAGSEATSNVVLSRVPQIRYAFQQAHTELAALHVYMQKVEAQLCEALRRGKIPSLQLQEAIATGKVKCVEGAIRQCHSLKQEVGSYALMVGTGFEQLDFLQCCKFAEGDTRILMQKMARDLLKAGHQKVSTNESTALRALEHDLAVAKSNGFSKRAAWDQCWRLVYALAEVHMQEVFQQYGIALFAPQTSRL